ncbi:MAG: D-alanyl-D-alanine carboxypeptidase/D-alanyl-D-alanine-endopeptidase [Saprospiraceae bacterium]|nr:D-alanyl-D-alanine carboxypeptidase/D-alanyl-D-alanine-endopeptidase [Saprospiraceae bacterium]
MKRYILVFSLLFLSLFTNGQPSVFEVINQWADAELMKHAHVGVAIHDVETGNLIAGYNHEKSFVPASSLKLFTSLISLTQLGSDFQYETKLAYEGILTDSILTGNLHIVGSGDPSLGSRRFAEKLNFNELPAYIASRLQKLGIKIITGNVICDESVFDAYPIAPSWQWNDLGSSYASGAWGLNVNENEYEIWYDVNKPGGEMADILTVVPDIPYLNLENEVFIADENSGDNAYIFGGPYTFDKRIVGTIPKGKQPFRVRGSIPDPPQLLARSVVKALSALGINSAGPAVHVQKKVGEQQLIPFDTLKSLPLRDLVKSANFFSLNLYSESFLKTLGVIKGERGSGSEGIRLIMSYMKEKGFDTASLHMEDGSGLSARNLVSPSLISHFLATYTNDNGIENTTTLLPMAGKEGTVRRLLKSSPAKGKVWMKSGSMNKIMSYTGLIKASSGKWLSFSIMVNSYNFTSSVMRNQMEALIEGIYKSL